MNTTELTTIIESEPTTRDRIGELYPFRSEKRREIESTWEVCPGQDGQSTGTVVLDLNTYHSASRKEVWSVLRVSLQCDADGPFASKITTIAFGARGESVNVNRTPCPRFSAKAMRDHHARALYLVRECSARHSAMTLMPGVEQYTGLVTA